MCLQLVRITPQWWVLCSFLRCDRYCHPKLGNASQSPVKTIMHPVGGFARHKQRAQLQRARMWAKMTFKVECLCFLCFSTRALYIHTYIFVYGGEKILIRSNLALKCIANFNTVLKTLKGCMPKVVCLSYLVSTLMSPDFLLSLSTWDHQLDSGPLMPMMRWRWL